MCSDLFCFQPGPPESLGQATTDEEDGFTKHSAAIVEQAALISLHCVVVEQLQ